MLYFSSIRGRLTPALLGALALVLVAVGCGVADWRLGSASRAQVAAASAHILNAEALLSALKDVQTGQRGYLLVGDESYLEPYEDGRRQVAARLSALDEAATADATWQVGSLRRLAEAKLEWTARSIELRRVQGRDAARRMLETFEGTRLMDEARAEVARVQELTRDGRATVQETADRRSIRLTALSLGCAIGATLLLAIYARNQRRSERRATALLGEVMANSPVGVGLLDTALRVEQGNAALAMLGPTPGGKLPEVIRQAIKPHAAAVLRGAAVEEMEVTLEMADGAPTHLLLSVFPLHRGGGHPIGIGLAASNVTSRFALSESLRRSEERLQMIIDSVPQLAWMTDSSGEIEWYNQRWYDFTGETPEAMLGSGWQKVHHPEHMEAAAQGFRAAIADGQAWEDTFPLRRADGEYRWFLSRALPLRERPDARAPEGRLIGWFGTNTDVTDMRESEALLQRAKAAAEEANSAKSQFLANMSHELRTPLSAVIGYSEMLEEEAADLEGGAAFREDLAKINANARHLLSLINDVLDLSKIEAGRMELQTEDFDLATLLREVAGTVEGLVSRKDNTLVLELDPALGRMHSDPVKLRQCLFNLLGNAAKFTEGGQITLGAAVEQPGRVVFRITDTGIGMTEEQLSRLFQRFSQADSSTTRRFGGSGLGLALTRAFVEMLGGSIDVTSEAGRGTCFRITMPLDVAPAPEALVPEADAGLPGGEAPLVLVIDDDPATRDLLGRFLRREGFAVRLASDGRAGLELARRLRPATILLDVMMPGLDGWGVLSALKADPALAAIPVVMVTMVQESGLAFSLGAAAYMPKPLDWSRLKRVLEEHRLMPASGLAWLVGTSELRPLLEGEGWTVTNVTNPTAAMALLETEAPPTVLLLELGGDVDQASQGFIHALRLRPEWRGVPVIVLAAGGVDSDALRRLNPLVHELRPGEDGVPEALVEELRRIAVAARAKQPQGELA